MSSSPTNLCTTCDRPARKCCNRCKACPNNFGHVSGIYFCDRGCIELGWRSHQEECNIRQDRRTLFRTCKVLQQIFFLFRKYTFDLAITDVKESTSEKLEVEISSQKGPKGKDFSDVYVPFALKHFENDVDAACFLAYSCCDNAIAWMGDIVKHALSDLEPEIREHKAQMMGVDRRVTTKDIDEPPKSKDKPPKTNSDSDFEDEDKDEDSPRHVHRFFSITMSDGLKYVFDPTSAQFGWYEDIASWEEYIRTRIEIFTDDNEDQGKPLGTRKTDMITSDDEAFMVVDQANKRTAETLLELIIEWEDAYETTLHEISKLTLEEFEEKLQELLESLEPELMSHVRNLPLFKVRVQKSGGD